MGVKIEGLEDVFARLDSLADDERIKNGLEKACMRVVRAAVEKAPKESGDLRRSIAYKVEGTTGIVYSPLHYAPYVEYGTGIHSTHEMGGRKDVPWFYYDDKENVFRVSYGQHAQPYMRPALEECREKILEDLGGELIKND